MFWMRVFWLEALTLPIYFLWQIGQAPAAPWRTSNLVLWSAVLLAGLVGFIKTRLKPGAGH
jgi:uncharacterized membrane protein YsdA (DUF1294 family)